MSQIEKIEAVARNANNPWFKLYWYNVAKSLKDNETK